MTKTNGMNILKKKYLKIAHLYNIEIEDCIVGSRKRQKTKNLEQKEDKRWNFGPTEINSKMYTSFIGIWILQKEIILGHFSADDKASEKHCMNDCLILEN